MEYGFVSVIGDVRTAGIVFVSSCVEIVNFLLRARRLLNHTCIRFSSIFKCRARFSRVVTSGYCVWEKNCSRISFCSEVNDERKRRVVTFGRKGNVSFSELSK